MEAKKIAKLVKVLVEAEVAKQQEKFLSKTFPKILKEEIKRIQELETHYSHLKIETNDDVLNEEEIDITDKKNVSQ